MTPFNNEYTEQLGLIRNHLDAMLDKEFAEEIGATSDRALHLRVLRVLDQLNEERAENARLRSRLDEVQKSHFSLSRDNVELREVLSAIANDPHAMALNQQAARNALES